MLHLVLGKFYLEIVSHPYGIKVMKWTIWFYIDGPY